MQGVVIAGTHSGCGKTTITLGILAALKKRGYEVQPFKAGPDFIDTGFHKLITGRHSRNLDLWMCGMDYVVECFTKHSADADIAVVEGVMGMYDGDISTADLAAALGLPVVLVVDAYGMAESAGAVVKGFLEYKRQSTEHRTQNTDNNKEKDSLGSGLWVLGSKFKGVIFNRVASDRHYKRLKESVKDVPVFGYLPRDIDFEIPHRHLGLVVAEENPMTSKEIDRLADTVLKHIDIETIVQNKEHPGLAPCPTDGRRARSRAGRTQNTDKKKDKDSLGSGLWTLDSKVRIGVAYDKAFCFYYEDNLDFLRKEGAEIVFFSPLSESRIPDDIDALYIGGGYPELYAEQLSNNKSMLASVNNWSNKGNPVYAECGGFMYLTEGIYDFENMFYPMVGAFPFKTKMTKGRAKLGYREVMLRHDFIFGEKGEVFRGHGFHYSEIDNRTQNTDKKRTETPCLIYSVKDGSGNYINGEGYRVKNTLGSYIHVHFGSNDKAAKSFVEFCNKIKINQVMTNS